MKKIIHKKKKCIGCGICVMSCPDFFENDQENGLVSLKKSTEGKNGDFELNTDLSLSQIECVEDAVKMCPMEIIHLNDN